jgi:acyl-CoA thioesterase-1
MSPHNRHIFACVTRAAVGAAVFCAVAAAQAQSIEAARIVAPRPIPIAAQPGMRTVTPAIIAPATRPIAALPNTLTPNATPQATCSAPVELTRFDLPLLQTTRRLASGEPLSIVAIGSSSTAGAGASSPDSSYPSRLAVELKNRLPTAQITVLNRGVNGEETDDMMARFASGVYPAQPQLVLWQVGTNSVLRDRPLAPHAAELQEGIDELKATGADVVLIDPQYSPKVLASPETADMVDQIALIAKEKNVDVFHRFAQMRDWHEAQHLPFDIFVSPDGLHMNDWGYACWAKLLAGSIAEAATRPVASAAARAHPAPQSLVGFDGIKTGL